MSRKRRLTSEDATPSKKGPHGGFLCRWCKKEVFPPFRTYCSENCAHEWKLRSDPAYLRGRIFMRDKGICRDCGLNTVALRLKLFDLSEDARVIVGAQHGYDAYHAKNLRMWEADHMVAVADGGGLTGLENFATRCVPCHRKKSEADRQAREALLEGS